MWQQDNQTSNYDLPTIRSTQIFLYIQNKKATREKKLTSVFLWQSKATYLIL